MNQKNKIYYWSPHFVNIATRKAVINSAYSVKKYSKNFDCSIINFFGEFTFYKDEILKKKVGLINYFNPNIINYLPKYGKIKSRFSYLIIFIFSFLPLKKLLDNSPSMLGTELASKVSTASSYTLGNGSHKIALIDYGVKNNIISCLLDRNCIIKVFPYNTSSEEILLWGPEGIMLSNGPGDPEPLTECIETVKELVDTDIPIFGICLGHQILCLSQGLKTEKMYNGHRGINHPVKNLKTGKCEITSQNHGFVVSHDGVKDNSNLEITHRHLNDNTIAGIALKNKNISSVQYHPESSPGPHDSRYLFDDFLENIKTYKKQLI